MFLSHLIKFARPAPQDPRLQKLLEKWAPVFKNLPHPFFSLDFSTFEVKWNPKMRSRAGVCRADKGIIELNPNLLVDDFALEEVFVHEICHLAISRRWPRAQPHGQKWQRLMSHCGIEPKRCHDLKPLKRHFHKRWKYACRCQIHTVSTVISNRIKKGIGYKCRKCGGGLRKLAENFIAEPTL